MNKKEAEQVKSWLRSDPNNKKRMEEYRQIWEASGEKEAVDGFFNPEKGWKELSSHILRDYEEKKKDHLRPPIFRLNNHYQRNKTKGLTQFMRVAAIVVIASFLGLLTFNNFSQKPGEQAEPVLQEISMEKGQRGTITLSDGTKVILNAESKIILPGVFKAGKREVTLIGEAYFDVTHNPDRPFIINTGQALVQVLGTSLNVRSYPDDPVVQVVVKEGTVSLKTKSGTDEKAILSAGELGQFFINDDRITKKKVDDLELYLSWTKGYLKFKDTPMHEVAERLERKYNMEVRFGDPELKDLRLTAELKSRRIEYNADVICTSLNMKYKMDQQVITFYREKK